MGSRAKTCIGRYLSFCACEPPGEVYPNALLRGRCLQRPGGVPEKLLKVFIKPGDDRCRSKLDSVRSDPKDLIMKVTVPWKECHHHSYSYGVSGC